MKIFVCVLITVAIEGRSMRSRTDREFLTIDSLSTSKEIDSTIYIIDPFLGIAFFLYLFLLQVQYSALHFFLGVGKTCPPAGLIGKTGWIPMRASIKYNILKLCLRLISMIQAG